MYRKTILVSVAISIFLTILVILHWRSISGRTGTIILPAGNTYLGPPSPTPSIWRTVRGRIYPYTFSVPPTVTLTTFPNDIYDIYAIAGPDPASNVLISIDPDADPAQTKKEYVQKWWKHFTSLTGVKSIVSFTNSSGLTGYKVKFTTQAGDAPNIDIFFEVPDKPTYVIHLTNGPLDADIFDKIVDSVGWEK